MRRPFWFVLLAALATPGVAAAFPHVARKGETLADLAARFYGRVELEKVLVAANGLDAPSPLPVAAGMRLEIPATMHRTVADGDTWETLADAHLGDRRRAEALALGNDSMPWLPPTVGREIRVPYVLRYVVGRGDTLPGISYRFLGKRDDAYVLDRFNALGGRAVEPGDVLLVPLFELALTDEGREAAARGEAASRSEALGADRDAQDRADRDVPELEREVRAGKYVRAVALGNELLGAGALTDAQEGRVQRLLLEAYAALDERELAAEACHAMRQAAPDAPLDPVDTSPKLLDACASASAPRTGALPEDP